MMRAILSTIAVTVGAIGLAGCSHDSDRRARDERRVEVRPAGYRIEPEDRRDDRFYPERGPVDPEQAHWRRMHGDDYWRWHQE